MIFPENKLNDLQKVIKEEKKKGRIIVWTNGCFDIMHPGHIETFRKAKELGDILVVGLNGKDSPYWKTKPGRPINNEFHRSVMLANLKQVDYVYIFNDETPTRSVDILKPNIVLKGGDYYIKELKVTNEKLKEKIEEFNKIVVKELIKKENGVIDITGIYRYFIENDLLEIAKDTKGFMGEGFVNVKNGGKVILVPIVKGYSTTNIVEKIKNLKI